MTERACIESPPIHIGDDLALVLVAGWEREPDGAEAALPLVVLVSTPDGITVLTVAEPSGYGPADAGIGAALPEAERRALTSPMLEPSGGGYILHHLSWPQGRRAGPPVLTAVARLAVDGRQVRLAG